MIYKMCGPKICNSEAFGLPKVDPKTGEFIYPKGYDRHGWIDNVVLGCAFMFSIFTAVMFCITINNVIENDNKIEKFKREQARQVAIQADSEDQEALQRP